MTWFPREELCLLPAKEGARLSFWNINLLNKVLKLLCILKSHFHSDPRSLHVSLTPDYSGFLLPGMCNIWFLFFTYPPIMGGWWSGGEVSQLQCRDNAVHGARCIIFLSTYTYSREQITEQRHRWKSRLKTRGRLICIYTRDIKHREQWLPT